MSHYDSCRDGYCARCGAAPGNMVNGRCPFCVTKPKANPKTVKVPLNEGTQQVLEKAHKQAHDKLEFYREVVAQEDKKKVKAARLSFLEDCPEALAYFKREIKKLKNRIKVLEEKDD